MTEPIRFAGLRLLDKDDCFRDVNLSTGRVIRHRRMSNGAQQAYIVGDERAGMTDQEYSEYCAARGFNYGKSAP